MNKTTSEPINSYETVKNSNFVPAVVSCKTDGRKRDVKRNKSRIIIAQEEVDLENLLREKINSDTHIKNIEKAIENLKKQAGLTQKELQFERNRLNAQLSRDR